MLTLSHDAHPPGSAARDATDALATAILLAPLIGATLLAKFAIPPLGPKGIAVGLLINAVAVGLGLATRRMAFHPGRSMFALLLLAYVFATSILQGAGVSVLSLLMFATLHIPYAFYVSERARGTGPAFGFLLDLALVIAWCGIAQFVLQFVIGASLAFPIENLLPKEFVVSAFNQQGPLEYGSKIFRSNGIVMLEPSLLSQLMAVAIVTELCLGNRLKRLPIYAVAMLLSYSGTGLMLLALCLPLLVIARRRFDLLLFTVLLLALLVNVGEALNLDLFSRRAAEFTSTRSSGFARFIGGFYFFDQFLWDNPLHALFGYGAGSMKLFAPRALYPVSEMALPKMVFEFGLIGAGLYFGFMAYCIASATAPVLVKLVIGTTLVLSGNYIAFAHGLLLSLLVWNTPPRDPDRRAPQPIAAGPEPWAPTRPVHDNALH